MRTELLAAIVAALGLAAAIALDPAVLLVPTLAAPVAAGAVRLAELRTPSEGTG